MASGKTQQISGFSKDENGTIAIIFALCAFVLVMITGLAIDMGRAYHAVNKFMSAGDAAALAAAKGLRLDNLDDAAVEALAKRYFDLNLVGSGGSYAKITDFTVNIDRAKGSVAVDVTADVPTLFAQVGGIQKIAFPTSSVAVFKSKDIEVGLQLDVTGSMGGQKIADLRSATKDLVDILLPDNPTGQKVRIGFAPFSAGVNVGALLKKVDGNRASANNCVYERRTATNEKTDVAPVGNDAFKIRSDLAGAVQACPGAELVPLTDDKDILKTAAGNLKASGSTAGQLGTMWAWYLVSPNWAGVWPGASTPVAYNDNKTVKTVILMTDGVYNTIGGVNKGDGSTDAVAVSKLSVEICAAMKAQGVVVYTIGFDLKSAGAYQSRVKDTLNSCASPPEKAGDPLKFYQAENGDALKSAFRAIAEDITSLRLSR